MEEPMTTIDDLLARGQQARAAADAEKLAQQERALNAARAALEDCLPADVWLALNIDPRQVQAVQRPSHNETHFVCGEALELAGETVHCDALIKQTAVQLHCAGIWLDLGQNQQTNGQAVATFVVRVTERIEAERAIAYAQRLAAHERMCQQATTAEDVDSARSSLARAGLSAADAARLTAILDTRRQRVEERLAAARRQAELDARVAERVQTLYAEYQRLSAEHDAAARSWAETETVRLWRPWRAWRIRYAPDFSATTLAWLQAWLDEHPDNDLVGECVVPDDQKTQDPDLTTRITIAGELRPLRIGALLDAVVQDYSAPVMNLPLCYHRSTRCGRYCVNIPAICPGEAVAPAPDLEPWDAWLTTRLNTVSEWEHASQTTQQRQLRLSEQDTP
jgi:hypothetical protein